MPHLLLKDLPRYECLLEAAREFPDLDPSAAEAFLHLLRTGDEVFAMTERNLSDHSISHGRFGVLMLLWRSTQPRAAKLMGADDCECGGPRTPAELADAAGVTRATMTGLIDTLERDGFVKREPDPDDRRMMSVRLTAKGDRFLNDFLPGHFKVITEVLSPLSENERKSLVRILTKVQAHIAALRSETAAQTAVR
ncbi:MAG: MarR family transcriptional regulator [Verrucomicrobiota bacterium]|nr:MarR family transcriptional regulator [Verrucomicrobiota bacterium]